MDASFLETLGIGVVLFVSTNIDDIVLLSVFFADRRLAPRNIVAGQFLGIGALVAVSIVAGLAALTVPQRWIALLGLIPLLLGLRELWKLRGGQDADDDDDDAELVEQSAKIAERRALSQVLAVTGVTIANGGDNLAVYIPVFANDVAAIPAYVVIFTILTGVLCVAGHALINNALLGERVRRYGHILLPVVLIALGVWLLLGAWPVTP
jgi:cadmium resistance protein CadD (predicted permease)